MDPDPMQFVEEDDDKKPSDKDKTAARARCWQRSWASAR